MLSVAVAGVGYALAGDILHLIGTPPDIAPAAAAYARATFIGLPVMVVLVGYIVLLRGTGDALTPLWAMILWIALSLMLIPALIQGWFGWPGLGVLSAPYGNLVACSVTLLALLLYLRRYRRPMAPDRAFLAALRVDRRITLRLLGIGLPAGLQLALVALSEVVVVSLVNAFGSNATAAYGVFNQVISYVHAPAQGAAVAASVFGAHAIGAGQPARLGAVTRVAVLLSVIVGTIAIGAVYVSSANILSWFIADPEPLSIVHAALMITLWSYLFAGVSGVLAGVMRSSGVVLWPTGILIMAIWLVEVPTAYWLSRSIGLDGVWIGYPAAFVAAFLVQFAYYALVWRRRSHRALLPASRAEI
jgi:putative MATE family efflux protein